MVSDRFRSAPEHPIFRSRLLCLLFWLLLGSSQAQAQSVEATVDSNRIVVGDTVNLSIKATGNSVQNPNLPRMADWNVQYRGQENAFSWINGQSSRSITFNYMLVPTRRGTLTIPPIGIQIDGQRLSTEAIEVDVVLNGSQGNRNPQQENDTDQDISGSEEDVQVEVELEPREVYVGQSIVQTVRIKTGIPTADAIQISRQSIPGTIDEPLNEKVAQRRARELINGRRFDVNELSWLFYPAESGPLQIPSFEVQVPVVEQGRRRSGDPFFDNFFSMRSMVRPRVFSTEQEVLQVKPLPSNRPDNFAGLVGKFEVAAELSQPSLAVGDSATLTVRLRGNGNVRAFELPAFSDTDFKVYDDAPTVTATLDNKRQALLSKTLKRAIVPLHEGELQVPAIVVDFFNPETGQFEQASTRSFALRVRPGQGGTSQPPPSASARRQEVKLTGSDILPNYSGPELYSSSALSLASPPVALGLAIPPLLFVGSLLLGRARARGERNPQAKRSRQARSKAEAALNCLRNESGTDARPVLDRLSRILRDYLGDKLNREGGALTPGELSQVLSQAGLDPALGQEVAAYFDRLEQARYAPGGLSSGTQALLDELAALIGRLEKGWR